MLLKIILKIIFNKILNISYTICFYISDNELCNIDYNIIIIFFICNTITSIIILLHLLLYYKLLKNGKLQDKLFIT